MSVLLRPTRRNIIPNPEPVGTTGWNHFEYHATLIQFEELEGSLVYEGVATAAECQMGFGWNDATQITVRGGENYGLKIPLDIVSRPNVGYLRVLVLWKYEDGSPGPTSYFGADLPVGEHEVEEVVTAPEWARRAAVSIMYLTTADMTPDTTTHLRYVAGKFLLEPLGPPREPIAGAVTNLVKDPSVEYGGYDWPAHTPDANLVLPGTTFAPQVDPDGDMAMRCRITAGPTIIPGTTFYGFVGAYVGALYDAQPGDVFRWQCDAPVLAGPVSGPGFFLEIFGYYYDGDPAHTYVTVHENSDSIFQPLHIGVTETHEMTTVMPPDTTMVQVTAVMAAGAPSSVLDFYAKRGLLTRNETPVGFFDGDTAGAGWTGLPGKSPSQSPGVNAPVPGDYFDGDSAQGQWEGEPYQSMSSYRTPILRHTALTEPNVSVHALQLVAAASAPFVDNGYTLTEVPGGSGLYRRTAGGHSTMTETPPGSGLYVYTQTGDSTLVEEPAGSGLFVYRARS